MAPCRTSWVADGHVVTESSRQRAPVLVIGAGAAGLWAAARAAQLGAQVTLLEKTPRLAQLDWHEHLHGCEDCRELFRAEEALETILAHTPQGRLIEPDEVAHAVLSLCGEGARGINGQSIVIDGGELLS